MIKYLGWNYDANGVVSCAPKLLEKAERAVAVIDHAPISSF